MIDWSSVLQPAELGLADSAVVSEVHARERVDRDGDPLVEVDVVLHEDVGLDDLRAALLNPIRKAIWDRVQAGSDAYPLIRFFTREDWDSLASEVTLEDDA